MKRFSKKISTLLLAALLVVGLIGCSSTAKVETAPGIIVTAPAETKDTATVEAPAPAPQFTEPEKTEEVASEPVVEPEAEESALVTREISMYGYSATIEAYDGYAYVTYPEIVTSGDIDQAVAALNAAYPGELNGVTYAITAPGKMTVEYPEGIPANVISAYLDVLESDLLYYVSNLDLVVSAPEPTEVEEAVVVEEPVVETVDVVEPEAEDGVLVAREISMYGYSATIEAYDGYAYVTYPEIVTSGDIDQAVAALNAAYPGQLEGVVYTVTAPGKMTVEYPEGIPADVIDAYLDALESDLVYYISNLDFGSDDAEQAAIVEETPAVEEVAVVEETPAVVEEVVSEEPVVYLGGIEEIEKNAKGDKEFDLYVVHTNDVHARIVPSDGGMGYSKFSSLLKMGRSLTDNILLLDAGDVSHGTNLANVFQGETVGVLLEMLGYDAVAPGNHDFNYGYQALLEKAKLAEEYSNLRVLAANVTDSEGNLVFQPYQVYDYNGYKVVVIGLATPDTKTKAHPKYTEGLEFMSDEIVNNAQAFLDYANEIGDFVIVLGHIGLDADGSSGVTSDWIASNLNGIDLFVDGHSHTVLEHGLQVNDTLIVSTGEYLKNFGVVEIHFNADGAKITDARLVSAEEVENPEGTILDTAFGIKEVPNDPEVDAYVAKMQAKLDEMYNVVVATIPTDLDGARENVRTKKTNLSRLVVAALTNETEADFTITNGGGIRASLKKGDVTLGDVNNVLPFTNTVAVCEITPAEVYAALEHGYSMLPETNGGYAQTDLQVIYSKTAPAGSRILRVLLNGKLLDRNDTTTIYHVATNDFMAAGGDGYTMFGKVVQVGRMMNEVFADYLAEVYPPEN